jgi:hypothetical protein
MGCLVLSGRDTVEKAAEERGFGIGGMKLLRIEAVETEGESLSPIDRPQQPSDRPLAGLELMLRK